MLQYHRISGKDGAVKLAPPFVFHCFTFLLFPSTRLPSLLSLSLFSLCVSDCLAGWLAGWLASWLASWLAGWVGGWVEIFQPSKRCFVSYRPPMDLTPSVFVNGVLLP